MAFVNTQLPPQILLGSNGGPQWDVDIIEYGQGARYVRRNLNQSRYRFSLRHIIEDESLFNQVINFFEALGGPSTGFLIDNWLDNSTSMGGTPADDDMSVGTGDGVTTQFSLNRTYTQGSSSTSRRIYKPKQDILIAVDGSPVTVVYDVVPGASEVSVDTNTGTITFGTAPADTLAITWGGGYYYPVALDGKSLDALKVGRQYDLDLSLVELLNPNA